MARERIAGAVGAVLVLIAVTAGAWGAAMGSCPPPPVPERPEFWYSVKDRPLFSWDQCVELKVSGRTAIIEDGQVAIFHGTSPELRYSLNYWRSASMEAASAI